MKKSVLLRHLQNLACLVWLASLSFTAKAQADSKGTDFWLMFNQNYTGNGATLNLFVTGDASTTGIVSVPGIGFSAPFTVTAGTVTTVTLPVGAMMTGSDVILNKGIHVTAAKEVTVYGLNRIQFTTDAFLALPNDILGREYVVMGYKNPPGGTLLGITATANATQVTITPAVSTGSRLAGVPYTIALNQGQTYQLVNTTSTADLSGTIITANQNIAVFGGHTCANVPVGVSFCDFIVEQLPPTSAWGQNFVTVPLKTRLKGDTFRFVASTNGTTVQVNGSAVATLNRGQFHEMILTAASQVTSNKPILVAQYSHGTGFDGVVSDPFMMLIPPYEQFLGEYTVTTPAAGFQANFINIAAPNAAIGSIRLNGTPVPASAFTAIGASGFSGAQLTISLGAHTLEGNLPFGVFVYGYDRDDSYGYPGGQSLSPVATVSSLVLSPKTGLNPVNTEHCVMATVKDQFNNPVAGVRVDFLVTRNNSASGFANTAANGVATFCYTGTNLGNDIIYASIGPLSDEGTTSWRETDKTNQSISFMGIPDKNVGDPAFNLMATASSGLPVMFTVLSGPATVSGNTVTLTGGTGVVRIQASQAGNAMFNPAPNVVQEFEVKNPEGPLVSSFTLVNADTNTDIGPLMDGDVIDLSLLPTTNLNIRANVNPPQVGSVYLFLNGRRYIEHTAPYTLFANAGNNYNPGVLPIGHHTLSATPYSGKWGAGTKGAELKVKFTVIGHKVTQFVLVNADTDEDLWPIEEGDVIDLALLPTENLNIRADLNFASLGSVVFFLNSKKTIEHNGFYALFGNNGGDYYGGTLPVGQHTLRATPYTKNYGQGLAGGELKVSFEIVGEKGLTDSKASRKLPQDQRVALSAYPNPARNLAHLDFKVAANGRAVVEVYDLKGALVTQLFDAEAVAGQVYTVPVDAGKLNNGVYLCRLRCGNETLTQRLVVAK